MVQVTDSAIYCLGWWSFFVLVTLSSLRGTVLLLRDAFGVIRGNLITRHRRRIDD